MMKAETWHQFIQQRRISSFQPYLDPIRGWGAVMLLLKESGPGVMVLPLTGLPAIGELPTQNQMVEHQKTALLLGVLARLGMMEPAVKAGGQLSLFVKKVCDKILFKI